MEKSNLTMAYQIDQVERTFPKRRIDDLPESVPNVLREDTLEAWWTGLSTMSGGPGQEARPVDSGALSARQDDYP